MRSLEPVAGLGRLRTMRAVRTFGSTQPTGAELWQILEIARWTGSERNRQPWELIVISDPPVLRELSMCGMYAAHVANAPVSLGLVMEGREGETAFDEGRLAERVMTAAWALGIGSCIASIFPEHNENRAKKLLAVPAHLRMTNLIALGYPQVPDRVASQPTIPRGRKRLEHLVSWDIYGRRAR